jgi:hypothetical protein
MKQAMIRAGYIKTLEWLIWLSQVDLRGLREGDWLNLCEKLHEFVCDPDPKEIFFKKATPESIRVIQQELKTRFDQCAGLKREELRKDAVFAITPFEVNRAKIHLTAWTPDLVFHQRFACEDLKTEVLLELGNVLVASGVLRSQIRRCPNDDCARIFLSRRQPRPDRESHCSAKCAQLAATRRYRQKKADELKAKDRTRGRRRYVAKQQKRFGASVKVATRPRKPI